MNVRIEGEPGHGPGWTWQKLTVDGHDVTVQVGHTMDKVDPMGPLNWGDATLANIVRAIVSAPDLLAALLYIVNDAPEGDDAQLTTEGYNRACAAIARAAGGGA